MTKIIIATFLSLALTTGCLGGGWEQERKTTAPEPAATPTWQEWLEEQVTKSKCENPDDTVVHFVNSRTPPYGAEFFCEGPAPRPDAAAVANVAEITTATPIRANPPTRVPYSGRPTFIPHSTPYLTSRTQARPRPTLAPVSTPTPGWQQPTKPPAIPTFNDWLITEMSKHQCQDPKDTLAWENAKRTWPYEADFWCLGPTPIPWPTPTPKPTLHPTGTKTWPTPTKPPARTPQTARPSKAEIIDERGGFIGHHACVESGGETLIKDITYAGTFYKGGPTGKGVESDPDWDIHPYETGFLQVWVEQESEFEHWKFQYECLIEQDRAIKGVASTGGWGKVPSRVVQIRASGFENNHKRYWELRKAMDSIQEFIRQLIPEETIEIEIDPRMGPFCGVAGGNRIAIKNEGCATGGIIAHEAAHMWFKNATEGRNWIDEGAADFIAAKVAPTIWAEEQPWGTTRCDEYKNISELERANPAHGDNCLYTLGLGIFLALGELDPEGFRKRLGALSQVYDPTIHDVIEVLGNTEEAKSLIAEWYYGEPNTRNTVLVEPWNHWRCTDCWD